MRLKAKTALFLGASILLAVLALGAISLFSFREFSMQAVRDHARTAAEIIQVTLTESMVNGTIARREDFLERIAEVEGLLDARVVRGAPVVAQFGPGLSGESEGDELDAQVLSSGETYFALVAVRGEPVFRATIPYVATRKGAVDCLACHQVAEGTVLGAVTLRVSMAHMKHDALWTVAIVLLCSSMMAALAALYFQRMVTPLLLTAGEIRGTVEKACEGDFSGQVVRRSDDEVGQIADDVNRLTAALRERLGQIRGKVAQLLQSPPDEGNLIVSTASMVESLVGVARFRQAIEEDESRVEIYARLARTLRQEVGVGHLAIYELDPEGEQLSAVEFEGQTGAQASWCRGEIFSRSSACRACRTFHVIDGSEAEGFCGSFDATVREQGLVHLCLPLLLSGKSGGVLQLVFGASERSRVYAQLPRIQAYLREMASVLEVRRAVERLRDSSLRDVLTGLRNRRFLEETLPALIASTDRRRASLSVVMLDLDHFKEVNDGLGHDAGDAVLKEFAALLSGSVRAADLVVRSGGEEFLVLLPDTDGDAAMLVAEKLRLTVAAHAFCAAGKLLHRTVSIGYAEYPGAGSDFRAVLKAADQALYRAKAGGRDRVFGAPGRESAEAGPVKG